MWSFTLYLLFGIIITIRGFYMDNYERFIEKYKELEYVVSIKYNIPKNGSEISFLERRPEFNKYRKELEYCREVRNFLQHECKIDKEFAVIPSEEMINLIDKIIDLVNNPITCYKICKKVDQIYYKGLNDYVMSSMLAMNHKKYTHIPIIENKKIVGVFSKTSIFNYLMDEDIKNLNSSLKFIDIDKYISLESETYIFCDSKMNVKEMEENVVNEFRKGNKVSMIFITSNGLQNGDFIGLLTPFDIMEY